MRIGDLYWSPEVHRQKLTGGAPESTLLARWAAARRPLAARNRDGFYRGQKSRTVSTEEAREAQAEKGDPAVDWVFSNWLSICVIANTALLLVIVFDGRQIPDRLDYFARRIDQLDRTLRRREHKDSAPSAGDPVLTDQRAAEPVPNSGGKWTGYVKELGPQDPGPAQEVAASKPSKGEQALPASTYCFATPITRIATAGSSLARG